MNSESDERETPGMPSEEEYEQIWLLEANRRTRELDRGFVQPICADEVQKKARVLLQRISHEQD